MTRVKYLKHSSSKDNRCSCVNESQLSVKYSRIASVTLSISVRTCARGSTVVIVGFGSTSLVDVARVKSVSVDLWHSVLSDGDSR